MSNGPENTIEVPYNWEPRNYQMPTWEYLESGGRRGVCVWHRRAGKDLFGINWCATAAMERPGLYWHLFPTYNQGRKIAWDGFTKDGRPFLDHFPAPLVESKNNTDMKLTLKTGGIYQVVGTDDPDRLVGCNPVGCIFSEYSLQDPRAWDIIRPILAENEGWALFIYTARGRNHGLKMVEMARKNPKWFCEVLKAGSGPDATKRPDGTPVISDEVIDEERAAGMPEELIQQEFFNSFDAPIVGAYYGQQMMKAMEDKRICKVPYDPMLPVKTAWDIGVGDATTIWFYQEYGLEIRVINYYENSGEGLAHYAKYIDKQDYHYSHHYGPWDIEVRELGTGKTRLETARSMGLKFTVVKQHSVDDGIEAVRNILSRCWFDAEKCERGIESLRQYRKDWDEVNKTYRDKPLHDWTSHGADAFRTLAWGFRNKSKHAKPPQERGESEYDPYSH
jgi:phage terminase large subunit